MKLNKKAFQQFFQDEFKGNYNLCGRCLQVSPAQVHRIINSDSQAGVVFLGRLIVYCKEKQIDYSKMIGI